MVLIRGSGSVRVCIVEKKLMISITQLTHWRPEATVGLQETLRDDLPTLQAQVNKGIARLWSITSDNGVSWMVTRVERPVDRLPELVICCYQGGDLVAVSERIISAAKQQGFGSLRYHTERQD